MPRNAVYTVGVLVALAAGAAAVLAGDTNPPPGPIGPTMKPLDQVEPRTPIASLPLTITMPGSYYLTGDLTTASFGIFVDASDVTIDLMGFTITGPGPASETGIRIVNFLHENLTVRNGTIRGFQNGVTANDDFDAGGGVTIRDLHLLDIGATGIDIRGRNNRVVDCYAKAADPDNPAPGQGISVFGGVITGCRTLGFGEGISGYRGVVISECTAENAGSFGIICSEGAVSNCAARDSPTNLLLINGSVVANTYAP